MKAPDKLFLQPEVVFGAGNIEGHTSNSYDTVYIRKEALMEWLEGQLETLKPLLDTDPYKEAYIGKCEAFKEVIDKLNSM